MKKHIPNIMGTTEEGDNLLSTPLTSGEFDELNGAYPHKTKGNSKIMNLEQFINGYITAALWSSTGDDGEPLDATHNESDIAPETLATMKSDCGKFFRQSNFDLYEYEEKRGRGGYDGASRHYEGPLSIPYTASDCAGHDFWLTRCGHGAGFWDRGVGETGERLTEAAEKFGNVDLYVGDDGKIYQ